MLTAKTKYLYILLNFVIRTQHFSLVCRASEGKTVEVPYRGDVNATMLDVLGGLRSACTYVGAGKLKVQAFNIFTIYIFNEIKHYHYSMKLSYSYSKLYLFEIKLILRI